MNPIAYIKNLSEVSEVLLNNFGDLGVKKNIHETLNYQLFTSLYSKKNASFIWNRSVTLYIVIKHC